jgi:hypothetical protein
VESLKVPHGGNRPVSFEKIKIINIKNKRKRSPSRRDLAVIFETGVDASTRDSKNTVNSKSFTAEPSGNIRSPSWLKSSEIREVSLISGPLQRNFCIDRRNN